MSNTTEVLSFSFPDPEGFKRYEPLAPEVVQELLAQGSPTEARRTEPPHRQVPAGAVVDLASETFR